MYLTYEFFINIVVRANTKNDFSCRYSYVTLRKFRPDCPIHDVLGERSNRHIHRDVNERFDRRTGLFLGSEL